MAALLLFLLSACGNGSSNDAGGGSADAAVGTACASLGKTARCPIAPGGTCLPGAAGECDRAAVPNGLACSGSDSCTMLVDPCPPLSLDSPTSGFACACFEGHWVCDDCAASGAECAEAGAEGPG